MENFLQLMQEAENSVTNNTVSSSTLPTLIIVDVQPEHEDGTGADSIIHNVVDKINNTNQRIICFFNGPCISGDTKEDVQFYFLKNGVNENKLNKIHFIEKDFGFLREWMDKGVNEKIIIDSLSYMKKNKIYSSQRFTTNDWSAVAGKEYDKNYLLREKHITYPFFHHKVFDKPELKNFEIIGGARYECLLEIELYLKSLGKNTTVTENLCYGTYKPEHKKKNNSIK
jgi:hypothetical protein